MGVRLGPRMASRGAGVGPARRTLLPARTVGGTLWRGEWEEAERELAGAMEAFEQGAPALVFDLALGHELAGRARMPRLAAGLAAARRAPAARRLARRIGRRWASRGFRGSLPCPDSGLTAETFARSPR